MPSFYGTICNSRCYIWCCKELLNGMIGLILSSQVAITSMANFPCLLMLNFQYTAFFFNIFDTEVMTVLAKISMCIFFFRIQLRVKLLYQLRFISPLSVSYQQLQLVLFCKKVSLGLPYLSLCLESRLSFCII